MSDGKMSDKPEWVKQLEGEPCECVSCSSCGGSGNVWFSLGGRYLGNHRCDDLDELETCEECRGSGTIETFDRCAMLDDYEMDLP